MVVYRQMNDKNKLKGGQGIFHHQFHKTNPLCFSCLLSRGQIIRQESSRKKQQHINDMNIQKNINKCSASQKHFHMEFVQGKLYEHNVPSVLSISGLHPVIILVSADISLWWR